MRARLGGLLLVPFVALAGSGVSVAQATAKQGATHPAERTGPAVSARTLISNFENCLKPVSTTALHAAGRPFPNVSPSIVLAAKTCCRPSPLR